MPRPIRRDGMQPRPWPQFQPPSPPEIPPAVPDSAMDQDLLPPQAFASEDAGQITKAPVIPAPKIPDIDPADALPSTAIHKEDDSK